MAGDEPADLDDETDYPEWAFAAAFEAFRTQRAALLAVLEPLPPESWDRTARVTGLVGGVGLRSARYYGDWMAGHERVHLQHIGRLVARVRGTRRDIAGPTSPRL